MFRLGEIDVLGREPGSPGIGGTVVTHEPLRTFEKNSLDRWSDMNTTPAPAFPYVKTGAYTLLNFDATYSVQRNLEPSLGFKNLLDDSYELAWAIRNRGARST